MQCSRSNLISTTLAALVVTMTGGCRLANSDIVESPLSWSEQKAEILRIAPLGTSRAETLTRLESAGVTGDAGVGRRIHYCTLWNRPSGAQWQLNLALFFDEADRLYEVRTADADVRPVSRETDSGVSRSAREPDAIEFRRRDRSPP